MTWANDLSASSITNMYNKMEVLGYSDAYYNSSELLNAWPTINAASDASVAKSEVLNAWLWKYHPEIGYFKIPLSTNSPLYISRMQAMIGGGSAALLLIVLLK